MGFKKGLKKAWKARQERARERRKFLEGVKKETIKAEREAYKTEKIKLAKGTGRRKAKGLFAEVKTAYKTRPYRKRKVQRVYVTTKKPKKKKRKRRARVMRERRSPFGYEMPDFGI